MKVGVIGTGSMGRNHVRVYHELDVLECVCDTDWKRASDLAEAFGDVSWANDVNELVNLELDAVSVATPTEFHVGIAERCLEAGMHVLCEKPISDDLKSAQRLVDTATASGKILAVGYIERYNPAFRALCQLMKDGVFGEITSVNIKRVGGEPRSATNVVLDLMTHDLNLLITMFGQYPDAIFTHKRHNGSIVDSAQVLMSFGSASATCEANWISPVKIRQIHVTGTEGYAEVDMLTQQITQFGATLGGSYGNFGDFVAQYASSGVQTTSKFHREPLKEELSAFIEACHTGDTSELILGEAAVNTLKLTLEAKNTVWSVQDVVNKRNAR